MNELDRGMERALRQAQYALDADEVPVGAVVMRGERLLGTGYNRIIAGCDPTAHAEMIAITAAAEALGEPLLEGCTLYTTLEPCPMCAGAILLAHIDRIVFGASDPKLGACGSLYNLLEDGRLGRKVTVIGGIREGACAEMLQNFFRSKRLPGATKPLHNGNDLLE